MNTPLATLVSLSSALADPSRTRALYALRGGELCACQVIELLGLAPSTVSRHMALLVEAGLVIQRKQGKWMHYRLADDSEPAVAATFAFAWRVLDADPSLTSDTRTLKGLRSLGAEGVCRRRHRT